MEFYHVLPLQVRVDLGVMAMKENSTHFRFTELKPQHQIQFSNVLRHPLWREGSYPPLQWIQEGKTSWLLGLELWFIQNCSQTICISHSCLPLTLIISLKIEIVEGDFKENFL